MLVPTKIKLLQKQRVVELAFPDGLEATLPVAYLRAHSPAADAKKNLNLQQAINIIGIDPVGNYAVKLVFDDGHQTGIYSFDILYQLAKQYRHD